MVNGPSAVNSGRNGSIQSAFKYTVFTKTSSWRWTTSSVTIVGMSSRVASDIHSLMTSAAPTPSSRLIGWIAAP